MTAVSFTIIAVVAPVLAVAAAVILARYSDRLANGFSRRSRLGLYGTLAIIYLAQAGFSFVNGSKLQTLGCLAAFVFWSAAIGATVANKPGSAA